MLSLITDSIRYIGVDDVDKQFFENQYPLAHGMAYNSYVIFDEKVAVLDTVELSCGDMWFDMLADMLGSRRPDYLIAHHVEPDHSANIARFLNEYPEATVVCTAKAATILGQFFPTFDFSGRIKTVGERDTLDLGYHKLSFMTAPMVHWPEVMTTYDATEKILFSADAFGKFGAIGYDDEWTPEARRYYANIVGKYGPQVQTLLKKIAKVDVCKICPLHGPVLTENIPYYIDLYDTWSRYLPETDGVLVAYSSIYGGTEFAALRLAEMLRENGVGEVVTADLCSGDVSEAVSQAFRLSGLVLAAPTYDAGLFPAMHDFIYHLGIKNFRARKVGLIENGSWAPIAAKIMRDMLSSMKDIEIVDPVVSVRSVLRESDMDQLKALASNFI